MAHSTATTPHRGSTAAGNQRQQAVAGLILAGLAGATYKQGGFYSATQWYLGVLLVAATVLAATVHIPSWHEVGELLRGWRTIAAPLALVGWILLDAGMYGSVGSGARLALLVIAVVVLIADCQLLDRSSVDLLLGGLLVLGAVVALIGWYGVATHREVLAITGQGMWRAAATLSYPSAAAALLVLSALIGIALRCTDRPPDRFRLDGALLTAVLTGLAATLSRGGLLAFAGGLLALLVVLGGATVLSACWAPLAGTLVALGGLLPAMPVSARPHPAVALLALAAGLAIGSLRPAPRLSRAGWPGRGLPLLAGLIGTCAVGLLAITDRRAAVAIGRARANLTSTDRLAAWHAVWHQIARHPVAGSGPGLRQLSWHAPDGSLHVFAYAHDEYLQLFAELGLIGLICLVGCGVSLVRSLHRRRPAAGGSRARWALAVAAVLSTAISALFDFTGHFPAITLTAAALVGCAGPARRDGGGALSLNETSQQRNVPTMKGETA